MKVRKRETANMQGIREMRTLVTNEFYYRPGRGEDVANPMVEILGESLQFEGCEIIRIMRDQDDLDNSEKNRYQDEISVSTPRTDRP
jgi:hypothetical protein